MAPNRSQTTAGNTQSPGAARADSAPLAAWTAGTRASAAASALGLLLALATPGNAQAAPQAPWPVTERQREAAERVAQAGVALADLAPQAPQRHTVQPGDTLWSLAGLFLKSPWRWPELWGMNLEQVRNPHRIYPGQTLVLLQEGGRARLMLAGASGTQPGMTASAEEAAAGLPLVRLSPRARGEALPALPIKPVSARALAPFLSETVVLETDDLARAPRIVGALDGRLLLSQGETAYVRGELGTAQDFRVFREPVPLRDPATGELLGYEARYVGRARALAPSPQAGTGVAAAAAPGQVMPSALRLTHTRLEATVGDRLAPAESAEWAGFVPRAPGAPVDARVVSFVGEGLSASQRQIVAVNRGARDGMERGHVLALWRAGQLRADPADPKGARLRFPDERHGTVMLVRVFERVSYALVLDIGEPVRIGDRLTQP